MLIHKNKKQFIIVPFFLLICGIAIVLISGWQLIRQTYSIQKLLTSKPQVRLPEKKFIINNMPMNRPVLGSKIGDMIIPSISLKYPIIHGDRDEDLEKGIGHFAGSTLPGENGNVVTCGHRDTVLRSLKHVKIGDEITIKTDYGSFNYKVSKIRIVEADDRTVVVSSDKEMLTIYTCYPFNYIGYAPQRYVVAADYINGGNTVKIQGGSE
jgi:sortase A